MVGIRSFDEGVVKYILGAQVENNRYVIPIEGLKQVAGQYKNRVPVYFVIAEQADVFPKYTLPAAIIRRRAEFDTGRLFSVSYFYKQLDNKDGGEVILKKRLIPVPINVYYAIQFIARYHGDMLKIMEHMLKRINYPYLGIRVDLGDNSYTTYEAVVEGVSDITELVDIAEKNLGFQVDLRVLGGLLLTPETTEKVITGRVIRVQ